MPQSASSPILLLVMLHPFVCADFVGHYCYYWGYCYFAHDGPVAAGAVDDDIATVASVNEKIDVAAVAVEDDDGNYYH